MIVAMTDLGDDDVDPTAVDVDGADTARRSTRETEGHGGAVASGGPKRHTPGHTGGVDDVAAGGDLADGTSDDYGDKGREPEAQRGRAVTPHLNAFASIQRNLAGIDFPAISTSQPSGRLNEPLNNRVA